MNWGPNLQIISGQKDLYLDQSCSSLPHIRGQKLDLSRWSEILCKHKALLLLILNGVQHDTHRHSDSKNQLPLENITARQPFSPLAGRRTSWFMKLWWVVLLLQSAVTNRPLFYSVEFSTTSLSFFAYSNLFYNQTTWQGPLVSVSDGTSTDGPMSAWWLSVT